MSHCADPDQSLIRAGHNRSDLLDAFTEAGLGNPDIVDIIGSYLPERNFSSLFSKFQKLYLDPHVVVDFQVPVETLVFRNGTCLKALLRLAKQTKLKYLITGGRIIEDCQGSVLEDYTEHLRHVKMSL